MPLNRPLGSMLASGLKEWKERAFSQHPPSPRVWSQSSQCRVAHARTAQGAAPTQACEATERPLSSYWKAEPLVLSAGLCAGSNVSFPAGDTGPSKNVQAGPVGSLPRTLARDGGLGPNNVQSSAQGSLLLQAFRAASVGTQSHDSRG